jgi:hypothetical protein
LFGQETARGCLGYVGQVVPEARGKGASNRCSKRG